jgi:hypothetical protein
VALRRYPVIRGAVWPKSDHRQSERAAIIYQHEARGADLAITSAIDAHIETAKASQGQPGDGSPEAQLTSGNGPLMAHGDQQDANELERHVRHAR